MKTIDDRDCPTLDGKVRVITSRNFLHTMLHIESELGISSNSKDEEAKNLHYFLRGVLIDFSKNLTSDLSKVYQDNP